MDNTAGPDINTLRTHWISVNAPANQDGHLVHTLLEALNKGRFRFHAEPWLGADHTNARELLLRAWDHAGEVIQHGKIMHKLLEQGLMPAIGEFLIFSALRDVDAEDHSAITVNALCATLSSKDFWDTLDALDHGHLPERVIFEILEYETDYSVDHSLMQAARDKGFRFALDDFYPDEQNWKRLDDFAPYLDYIKLDGKFVREGLSGRTEFSKTIADLKDRYPGVEIIAEQVETAAEARMLFSMGIHAVQGRALPEHHLALHYA
ncbi:MAG: EAL domain-containing protein [Rhodospirillales bacterium]|nr:EAL domain-containing protein [Rhodospirillales bacterium]MCB9996278.1 EAL domain-containing protein [Rhodospirillales bacterium]